MNIDDEFVTEFESVSIELDLKAPQLKRDVNSFILSILNDLNIDPASSLYTISFISLNKSNFVQKISLHFKNYEGKLFCYFKKCISKSQMDYF